jgi:hypothetical protein
LSAISWCDKLASTPGVGVGLDWAYLPSSHYQQAMTPVTSKWVDDEKQAFNIDSQDAYTVAFTSFDGFHYGFNSSRIYTEFRHRMKYLPQSAGPPTAELISKPLPYTQLLPLISDRLIEATRLVVAGSERTLKRVGIVATTAVIEDEAPPGVRRFIDYICRPWAVKADNYNIDITSKLPKSPKSEWSDRCQHVVTKPEHGDGLVTFKLDYQRVFDSPKTLSIKLLDEILQKARIDALKYFEDVGQGERFDENIIADRVK